MGYIELAIEEISAKDFRVFMQARVPLYAAYKRAGAAARYEFGDAAGSLTLFELNAATFPQDWNVHDSLGEALLKAGDKSRAIESYRKSVELNPHNDNGRNVLRELGEPLP